MKRTFIAALVSTDVIGDIYGCCTECTQYVAVTFSAWENTCTHTHNGKRGGVSHTGVTERREGGRRARKGRHFSGFVGTT